MDKSQLLVDTLNMDKKLANLLAICDEYGETDISILLTKALIYNAISQSDTIFQAAWHTKIILLY